MSAMHKIRCCCFRSHGCQVLCRLLACLAWVFLSPITLVYMSIEIYVVPCLWEYMGGAISKGFYAFLSLCCKCVFKEARFRDTRFPPNVTSIGGDKFKSSDVEWIRAPNLVALALGSFTAEERAADEEAAQDDEKGHAGTVHGAEDSLLFANGITPSDICQGQLGDCWLLSAIACLAEHEGAIQRVFKSHVKSTWGRYHVRLFDGQHNRWRDIVVDDYIPVDPKTKRALFTHPSGHEMWVLILEKAFAKLVGSYSALEGGMSLWALEALTGDYVSHFCVMKNDSSRWEKRFLVHQETDTDKRKAGLQKVSKRDEYDRSEVGTLKRILRTASYRRAKRE
mmetsp:Transcript_64560/g.179152  ORF Transcript_64560/g.179152 Transcript_64560/m.179152 type:complete len:338 (-) Transcript_64560:1150-2163(-)